MKIYQFKFAFALSTILALQATLTEHGQAQQSGTICQTEIGTCRVTARPIGSLCFCGTVSGQIVE